MRYEMVKNMKENKITWRNLNPKMKKCWLLKGAIAATIYFVFFVILPIGFGLATQSMDRETMLGFDWLIIVGVVLLGIYIIWVHLFYPRYRYAIGVDGVLIKRGILWKSFRTIPYGRIQHVSVDRGPIEQLLGLHNLNIFTAGTGSLGSSGMSKGMWGAEGYIPGLVDPEKLKSEIMGRVKPTALTSGLGEETSTTENAINVLVEETRKIRELLERK